VDGDYMGEHWLASFATYALMQKKKLMQRSISLFR